MKLSVKQIEEWMNPKIDVILITKENKFIVMLLSNGFTIKFKE